MAMSVPSTSANQIKRRAAAIPPIFTAETLSNDVKEVLADLCKSLSGLIEALPSQPARPTDVAKVLGINGPLAWQVFRVATASDPFESVQYLPTSRQLLRVVDAAEQAGATEDALELARVVCERYHTIATSQAKDHAEFESLLGSLASGAAEQIDVKHRRALFRGNSHVYGIQARTVYAAMILHARKEPEFPTASTLLLGRVGVHAMRPNVPLTINAVAIASDKSAKAEAADLPPIAPDSALKSFPIGPTRLIEGLASQHRLKLEQEAIRGGKSRSRVVFPGIGRGASVSFMLVQDFLSRVRIGSESTAVFLRLTLPCEKLVLDLLIPEGHMESPRASVKVYANRDWMEGEEDYLHEHNILPIRSTLVHTPGVQDVPSTPDVPGLSPIVRQVMREKDWHGTKYDFYRCTIDYPIMHARAYLRVEPTRTISR